MAQELTGDAKRDPSMSYHPGSVVFLVEGHLFQLPKAMLQQYEGAFADMLNFEVDSSDPIRLDDTADNFRAFCSVIYKPFDSCLFPGNTSSSSLAEVLKVLRVAHKYCISDIEKKARSLAVTLSYEPIFRRQISEELTAIHILEAAVETKCDSVAQVARKIIIEEMRGSKSISPYDVLTLGEKLKDVSLQGRAMYEIILLGKAVWEKEPRLNATHRQTLTMGLINCYEAWDRFSVECAAWKPTPFSISPPASLPSLTSPPQQYAGLVLAPGRALKFDSNDASKDPDSTSTLLQRVWTNQSLKGIPSYDVVGKLEAIIALPLLPAEFSAFIRSELNSVQDKIGSTFFPSTHV